MNLPPVTPRISLLDAFETKSRMDYIKQQREGQKLKNAEQAIELGLREAGFTNTSNWNEFIDRQVQRGVFNASYGASLKQQGYSPTAVEDLRQRGMDIYKQIQFKLQERGIDQNDRKLDLNARELDIKDRALDYRINKGRGGGGYGGAGAGGYAPTNDQLLGGSGGGLTDFSSGNAGMLAPRVAPQTRSMVPVRRSVPVAPSGCSGGTCPVPVSGLNGDTPAAGGLASLMTGQQGRDTSGMLAQALRSGTTPAAPTASSLTDAITAGYRQPTAQAGGLSQMLAAADPGQMTMTDARIVPPDQIPGRGFEAGATVSGPSGAGTSGGLGNLGRGVVPSAAAGAMGLRPAGGLYTGPPEYTPVDRIIPPGVQRSPANLDLDSKGRRTDKLNSMSLGQEKIFSGQIDAMLKKETISDKQAGELKSLLNGLLYYGVEPRRARKIAERYIVQSGSGQKQAEQPRNSSILNTARDYVGGLIGGDQRPASITRGAALAASGREDPSMLPEEYQVKRPAADEGWGTDETAQPKGGKQKGAAEPKKTKRGRLTTDKNGNPIIVYED